MTLVAALFAPLALLLPAANPAVHAPGPAPYVVLTKAGTLNLAPQFDPQLPVFDPAETPLFDLMAQSFEPQAQNQVRIEQRVTIRITPAQPQMQPNMLAALPSRAPSTRIAERAMANCVPVAGIAGVQAAENNRLILYLRDSRVVSAALDRTCSSRDFYSGFYMQRSADGQLCVKRDTLLSRSGANCKLSRFRQLVEVGN
jgi:hypothetical protein